MLTPLENKSLKQEEKTDINSSLVCNRISKDTQVKLDGEGLLPAAERHCELKRLTAVCWLKPRLGAADSFYLFLLPQYNQRHRFPPADQGNTIFMPTLVQCVHLYIIYKYWFIGLRGSRKKKTSANINWEIISMPISSFYEMLTLWHSERVRTKFTTLFFKKRLACNLLWG